MKEILYGKSTKCRSCSVRDRMAQVPEEILKAASARMNSVPRFGKYLVLEQQYGKAAVSRLRGSLAGARQRCVNPNCISYQNYGGRGIKFGFTDVYAAVLFCLSELGPIPDGESIDRIDNDRGYEPGNLRWATVTEQARNRRQYRRAHTGRAIRRVMQHRSDLTYETVRNWLRAGVTEQEAMERGKYVRTSI